MGARYALRIMRFGFPLALAVLCLFFAASPAAANAVTWTLSGVTFSGGGTAAGSFVFDADANTFSSIDITVSGASFGDGTYTLLDPGFPSSGSEIVAVLGPSVDFIGMPVLALDFASPLTDAGGTINLLTTGHGIQECVDPTCSGSFTLGAVSGGSVTTAITSTPEPSSLLLLGSGLLGLMRLRRKVA